MHRFCDLVNLAPGVSNTTWKRLLNERVEDALELRNCVQHQNNEIDKIEIMKEGGQIWGYLSWAEIRNNRYTGLWRMMSPGAVFDGDRWFYIGPASLPGFSLPGRIRLTAFGKEIYLGRLIFAVHEAIKELEKLLDNGDVKPMGPPTRKYRTGDIVYSGSLQVLYSVSSPEE